MASIQRELQFRDKDQQRLSGQYSKSAAIVRLHPAVIQHWKPEAFLISVGSMSANAQEKSILMQMALNRGDWMDAQFYGYELVVLLSKSLLVSFGKQIRVNTAIINLFEKTFIDSGLLEIKNLHNLSLRIPLEAIEKETVKYVQEVEAFCHKVVELDRLKTSASR